MWKNKKVTVVFPAYNEEKSIRKAIDDFFSTRVVDEIIVVDNNSTDKTYEIAKKTDAKVVKELLANQPDPLAGFTKHDYNEVNEALQS